jgi:hypothetical protein
MLQQLTTAAFRQLAEVLLRFKGPTSEHSHKLGKSGPRYVREMVYPTPQLDPDPPHEWLAQDDELWDSLQRSRERAAALAWIREIEQEHVFLVVADAANLRLTISIDQGEITLKKGWDLSRPPTLVVPVMRQNLLNLEAGLAGGELSYDERYRGTWLLSLPAARRMYSIPLLREPGDKSWIGMDDFVHIVIPPEQPVMYEGRELRIELTVVNVDGQWLVFPGLQGDPDARFELSIDDAARWYKSAVYDMAKVKETGELMRVAKDVAEMTQRSMTYLRADHR